MPQQICHLYFSVIVNLLRFNGFYFVVIINSLRCNEFWFLYLLFLLMVWLHLGWFFLKFFFLLFRQERTEWFWFIYFLHFLSCHRRQMWWQFQLRIRDDVGDKLVLGALIWRSLCHNYYFFLFRLKHFKVHFLKVLNALLWIMHNFFLKWFNNFLFFFDFLFLSWIRDYRDVQRFMYINFSIHGFFLMGVNVLRILLQHLSLLLHRFPYFLCEA